MNDHLIIIGYGVNGRNVALSARSEGIPYIIVDIDPETARSELKNGEPIRYGDATQEHVLLNAGVKSARVMVVAISDRSATRRVTDLARRLNPDIYIIDRTRYIHEMSSLFSLGANEVIPEEYETSVEIFCRVLERYQVPKERIDSFINHIRADGYQMFRSISSEPYCNTDLSLTQNEFVTLRVLAGSPAAGRALKEIGLKEMGADLLAVNRAAVVFSHPDEGFVLLPDDVAIILGSSDQIPSLGDLFGTAAPSQNVAS
jgi:CPA2 family monovalent cation:H+ antiporter-2